MRCLRVRPGFALVILALCLLGCPRRSAGQQKPPADPAIVEGVALHDKGEFDKAIARFQEALSRDPENGIALYEMSLSYYAKKDYAKAIETAEKGLALRQSDRAGFYLLIGNAKDDLDDQPGAIAAYQAGIRENPVENLLRYNLAIALLNQKKTPEARAQLQQDIMLAPGHASGHFYLAKVYQAEGYFVPALLAYCRFLVLEPMSARSRDALANIDRLFAQRNPQSTDKEGKVQLNITVDMGAKKDEGDFSPVELVIAIDQVPDVAERRKKSENPTASKIANVIDSIGAVAGQSKGFAIQYYVPYFKALSDEKLGTLFANAIVLASSPEGRDWVASNQKALEDLLAWSQRFVWPKF